jgi:NDP-sugar pyrophosphorylase family protein
MAITLIYMVAGLSSRFGGKIKQFAIVGPNNETLIEYSINQAINSNLPIKKIVFIVGEKTEQQFKQMFKDNYKGIPIHYTLQSYNKEQRDKPWGTAEALTTALPFIEDQCVLCNGDDLYGETAFNLIKEHLATSNEDLAIYSKLIDKLPNQGEVTRGIFTQENNYLTSAIEIFNLSKQNFREKGLNENSPCNINLFSLNKKTIENLKENVENFKKLNELDRKKECFIHVELANLAKNNQTKIKLIPINETILGLTNPEDEQILREELKQQKIKSNSIH